MTTASKKLLFGTAGVPLSSPLATTLAAIEHIKKLGLDCLEVEFVRGVKMGSDTAHKIRDKAASLNICLSVHAPYYVNLNSTDEGKRLASQERLASSARLAEMCGARSVVFHGGYYGHSTPEETYETIKKGAAEVLSALRAEGNTVNLRLETMGKKSQFGSLEEVLFMCREVEGLFPCLDFSHIHARDGAANTYRDFARILRKVEKKLGGEELKDIHIHIAGVHYGDKGEVKHLNLIRSDFNYEAWVRAIYDLGVAGMLICESPNLETDALMLKNLYNSYRLKG